MDHLPYPENPGLPLVQVPYCCHNIPQYDRLGFVDFPDRYEWNTQGRRWHEHSDPNIIAGRAQSWLYFGLLAEFFGDSFELGPFVQSYSDFSNRELVTSRPLPALIKAYRRRRRPVWLRHRLGWGEVLPSNQSIALITALDQVRRLTKALENHDSDVADAVELSIYCLIWSLRNAAINKDVNIGKQSMLRMTGTYPRLLTHRFKEAGHCPSQMKFLFGGQFSTVALYYLSGLPYQQQAHQNCTVYSCVGNNIDEATYTTKHVEPFCDCTFYGVDTNELSAVIESGEIPVIQITVTRKRGNRKMLWSRVYNRGSNNLALLQPTQDDGNELQIRLIKGTPDITFHAVSHVWAHGLGNPIEPALPRCQLLRIFKEALELSQGKSNNSIARLLRSHDTMKVCIWMDTLCIPPGEHMRDVRKQAISQMDAVFVKARDILILDSALCTSTCDSLHMAAFCIGSVLVSTWMTRCWTFQEAYIAQGWSVVFKDRLYHAYDWLNSVEKALWAFDSFSTQWTDSLQLLRELSRHVMDFVDRHLGRESQSGMEYFCKTWNQLTMRNTSHARDIHIIFANLTGLQVSEILNLEHSERTKAILNAQSTLPISFLFTATKDDIQTSNSKCDWVPLNIEGYLEDSLLMHKDLTRGGFRIPLEQSGLAALWVEQPQFNGRTVVIEADFGIYIQCEFPMQVKADLQNFTGFIFLFTNFDATAEDGKGLGACLRISTDFTGAGNDIVATFVSACTYVKTLNASMERDSSSLGAQEQAPYIKNRSMRLLETNNVLLDCDIAQWPVVSRRQVQQPKYLRGDMLSMMQFSIFASCGIGVFLIIGQMFRNGLEGALLPMTIGGLLLYCFRIFIILFDAMLVLYSRQYFVICNEAWCNSIATKSGIDGTFGPWSWRFLQSWKLLLVEFLLGSITFVFCWPSYNARWFGIAAFFLALEVVLRIIGEYPARILSGRRRDQFESMDSNDWARTMHDGVVFFPDVLCLKLLSKFTDPVAFPESYKRSGLFNSTRWEAWLTWVFRILS